MVASNFLTRVVLRNYKSIAACDVRLGPLTYLVGANGSGKSNFLDALHLVRDALTGSLDNALNERGGLSEVRRRSSGHPTHFGIRLEFRLPSGQTGYYAFKVGGIQGRGEVLEEACVLGGLGRGPYFQLDRGKVKASSEETFPAVTSDRLALVSASGLSAFRPVFDAFTAMGFYNLNPKLIRELQKPQDGRLLKPAGENIASVIGHLERIDPPISMQIIAEYLQTVVPMVHGVARKPIGPMETLEFRQDMAGAKYPWHFLAQNMSDGTLRALGVLTALFQGNADYSPSLIGIEEPETALHPAASSVLREALQRASEKTQVIVTSHSPDLLDDSALNSNSLLAVVANAGETRIAPLDEASRYTMRDQLFTAGELLRLNQIAPDPAVLAEQDKQQPDLFEESER